VLGEVRSDVRTIRQLVSLKQQLRTDKARSLRARGSLIPITQWPLESTDLYYYFNMSKKERLLLSMYQVRKLLESSKLNS
jgi:hypothetical protein